MKKIVKVSLSLAFLVFLSAALWAAPPQGQQPASSPPIAGPDHPVVSFDVNDCKGCHAESVFNSFEHTRHAGLSNSCSQCHGDVAAHAASEMAGEGPGPVIRLKQMTAKQVTPHCLRCHDRARQANFTGGMHDRRGVGCTSCHSVHAFTSQKAQLKTARDAETCYSCHPAIRSLEMRQSHHPVREGKMDCGSCHDPHDGLHPKMVNAESINEKCYSCHTEKRGPFLWEHAPVRENCMYCHNPHGSNHERLLVTKQPYLCQQCHLATRHPGTLYDLRNTAVGSNPSNRAVEHACRNCHQNVHGSNAPSGPYFGR